MFLLLVSNAHLFAQVESFTVGETPFSSSVNDEFAPMYFHGGIVFSSNAMSNASIKSDEGKLFNILYAVKKDSGNFKTPELFSKELTTILNEGPVSFTTNNQNVFYARNNEIEGKFKDINSPSNTMGIYIARLKNGVWDSITALPFNSDDYSLGTPAWSENDSRLYFASDMPGGFGGTDIFYTEWVGGKWKNPVNLGAEVNTAGNESYPFISPSGLLIFASDGLPGFGGKDIFYTVETTQGWQKPIHLDGAINSEFDDFGLITDVNFSEGYFSSNRKHSRSIYSFKSIVPQFGYCDTLESTEYCYEFIDERFTDTLHLEYFWNFGKGIIKKGYKVNHCFNRIGVHEVLLTIRHNLADSVFETKAIHRFVIDHGDSFSINHDKVLVKGDNLIVVANTNEFKEFEVKENYWNFGEGYKLGGDSETRPINTADITEVKLGMKGNADAYGRIPHRCLVSPIQILEDYQQLANYFWTRAERESDVIAFKEHVITTSKKVISYGIYGSVLTNNKSILNVDKIESFINRPNWRIEIENGEISPVSIDYLKEIARYLLEQDNIRVVIAVHTGVKGNSKNNLEETRLLATEIESLFITTGYAAEKIQCIGYGAERPILQTKEKAANIMNQRIEFIVLDSSEE